MRLIQCLSLLRTKFISDEGTSVFKHNLLSASRPVRYVSDIRRFCKSSQFICALRTAYIPEAQIHHVAFSSEYPIFVETYVVCRSPQQATSRPTLCVWGAGCMRTRRGWDLLTKDEEDSRAGSLPSTLPGVCILRIQRNMRDGARAYHLENYDKWVSGAVSFNIDSNSSLMNAFSTIFTLRKETQIVSLKALPAKWGKIPYFILMFTEGLFT